ncbi:hypothetical protein T439DRAFT_81619 [Meredithblackwellia eburnea MCA 4105]
MSSPSSSDSRKKIDWATLEIPAEADDAVAWAEKQVEGFPNPVAKDLPFPRQCPFWHLRDQELCPKCNGIDRNKSSFWQHLTDPEAHVESDKYPIVLFYEVWGRLLSNQNLAERTKHQIPRNKGPIFGLAWALLRSISDRAKPKRTLPDYPPPKVLQAYLFKIQLLKGGERDADISDQIVAEYLSETSPVVTQNNPTGPAPRNADADATTNAPRPRQKLQRKPKPISAPTGNRPLLPQAPLTSVVPSGNGQERANDSSIIPRSHNHRDALYFQRPIVAHDRLIQQSINSIHGQPGRETFTTSILPSNMVPQSRLQPEPLQNAAANVYQQFLHENNAGGNAPVSMVHHQSSRKLFDIDEEMIRQFSRPKRPAVQMGTHQMGEQSAKLPAMSLSRVRRPSEGPLPSRDQLALGRTGRRFRDRQLLLHHFTSANLSDAELDSF